MKGIFIETLHPEITLKSGKVITFDYSYKEGMYYREMPEDYTEEFTDSESILQNIERLSPIFWNIQSTFIRKKKYIEKSWLEDKICNVDDIQSLKIGHSVILMNDATIETLEKKLSAHEFIQYLTDNGLSFIVYDGLDLGKGDDF